MSGTPPERKKSIATALVQATILWVESERQLLEERKDRYDADDYSNARDELTEIIKYLNKGVREAHLGADHWLVERFNRTYADVSNVIAELDQ